MSGLERPYRRAAGGVNSLRVPLRGTRARSPPPQGGGIFSPLGECLAVVAPRMSWPGSRASKEAEMDTLSGRSAALPDPPVRTLARYRRIGTRAIVAAAGALLVSSGPAVGASGWANAGAMGDARGGHTATLLQNGKVLVTAGTDG